MKNIIIILLFTFCSQYLLAQAQPEMKVDSVRLKRFLNDERTIDLLKRYQQSHHQDNDTTRYSHEGFGGDVYHLQQDNMPCLRPENNLYLYNQPNPLLSSKNIIESIIGMPVLKGKPLVWEKKP